MLENKNQIKQWCEKTMREAIDNFMIAVKQTDLPMTEEICEKDFIAFLQGHFDLTDDTEDDKAASASV